MASNVCKLSENGQTLAQRLELAKHQAHHQEGGWDDVIWVLPWPGSQSLGCGQAALWE